MRKKYLFFLAVILLIAFYFFYQNKHSINLKSLTGQFIIVNPNMDGPTSGKGFAWYDLNSNTMRIMKFGNQIYGHLSINDRRDKILTVAYGQTVEYSIIDSSKKIIYDGNYDRDLSYIPNSSNISMIKDLKILKYDIKAKQLTEIVQLGYSNVGYSWSKDGNSLVYDLKGKIYNYDLKEQKSSYLFDGNFPVYSKDNQYMAYRIGSSSLVVKELKTGKEWRYNQQVYNFRFSPDNEFIAVEINSRTLLSKGMDIKIWEFKKNRFVTLIKDISIDSSGPFEWISN